MLSIIPVSNQKQLDQIKSLLTEYSQSLGFDLGFQNFAEELRQLPGEFDPPTGRLLLALYGNEVAGCVALRRIADDVCEMKRLYVRPEFRGKGIGRALALTIVREAKAANYLRMRLDTIISMKEAIALYRSMGFIEIKPYRHNPIDSAKFMELIF